MVSVVITGFGAFTPLGSDAASTWENLLAGKTNITTLTEDWAEELPVRFAAKAIADPLNYLDRVTSRRLDRCSQFALIAGLEAWQDAGLAENNLVDPSRLCVSVGIGIAGLQSLLANWDIQKNGRPRNVSPFTVPMLMANAPAANLALQLQATGSVHAPVSACASGNEAISVGLDQLLLDRCDVAVVGGSEA
ncbi:MAG: beta-ketoacyl-[acyl-carrier-protein] synthase II, partial [Propionibacterium sp.]